MSKLQQIIKEQDKKTMFAINDFHLGSLVAADKNLGFEVVEKAKKYFLNKIHERDAKIIKAVCEEMTGKEKDLANIHFGYNTRVQEEIEKAKEIEGEVER